MNKILKILLAIIASADVFIHVATPIVLVSLWISVTGLIEWRSYLFFGVGLLATLFRGIKVGVLKYKKDEE